MLSAPDLLCFQNPERDPAGGHGCGVRRISDACGKEEGVVFRFHISDKPAGHRLSVYDAGTGLPGQGHAAGCGNFQCFFDCLYVFFLKAESIGIKLFKQPNLLHCGDPEGRFQPEFGCAAGQVMVSVVNVLDRKSVV